MGICKEDRDRRTLGWINCGLEDLCGDMQIAKVCASSMSRPDLAAALRAMADALDKAEEDEIEAEVETIRRAMREHRYDGVSLGLMGIYASDRRDA